MMMMMMVVMMGWAVRLCTRNRERDSGDGSQNESKVSHEHLLLVRFLSAQKDGESIHPRQTDIYEWSFRKGLLRRGHHFGSPAEYKAGLDLAISRGPTSSTRRQPPCSKAQRENRAQVRDREPACSAPAAFAFLGHGDALMLLLRFKATLFGGAGKSGRPPPLEPSLKVQRNTTHNQSSGFAIAPRVKASTRAGL
jgi:hypothetical protein